MTAHDAVNGGEHQRRRLWPRALAAVLALACLLTGITLAVRSSHTTQAQPAPLPRSEFNLSRLPPLSSDPIPEVRATAGGPLRKDHVYLSSVQIAAPYVPIGAVGSELNIPQNVQTVGHWTGGADVNAAQGTTLLAGHVDYVGQGAGAFYRLYRVEPGAVVVVTDGTGQATVWRVTSLSVIVKTALPAQLFTNSGPRRLVLITCGGPLLHQTDSNGQSYNTYRDNVVVTATPA